ncbi:MAG: NYN domain-containing protein [Alphaproteobacteria bacterium]
MANIKLFVDFWNFQLSWKSYFNQPEGKPPVRIAWKDVPQVLMAELPAILGPTIPLVYKGTRVYSSVSPTAGGKEQGLKKFLHGVLGQMTGFQVNVRERRSKTSSCPHCTKTIQRFVEKGVDTSIVSDLFEGAINDSYDVAILMSNDSDFVPAIATIQDRLNKQVIHAGFKEGGAQIRTGCWSHIFLDGPVSIKLREPTT